VALKIPSTGCVEVGGNKSTRRGVGKKRLVESNEIGGFFLKDEVDFNVPPPFRLCIFEFTRFMFFLVF
jgi:hypothetical protein